MKIVRLSSAQFGIVIVVKVDVKFKLILNSKRKFGLKIFCSDVFGFVAAWLILFGC